MRLTEVGEPFHGQFNRHILVSSPGGLDQSLGLMRVGVNNPDMMANLIDEYRVIGFTQEGGRVRRRTPQEQYNFSQEALRHGLRILPPISFENGRLFNLYLPSAERLDNFMNTSSVDDSVRVINQIITDLYRAHTVGIVYGDRWSGNMLVDPVYGFLHIDFDIEISGPFARELDVAQMSYHTLHAGGDKIMLVLAQLLNRPHEWFDRARVIRYIRGLSWYFRNTPVGGIDDNVEELCKLLCIGKR